MWSNTVWSSLGVDFGEQFVLPFTCSLNDFKWVNIAGAGLVSSMGEVSLRINEDGQVQCESCNIFASLCFPMAQDTKTRKQSDPFVVKQGFIYMNSGSFLIYVLPSSSLSTSCMLFMCKVNKQTVRSRLSLHVSSFCFRIHVQVQSTKHIYVLVVLNIN